MSRFSRFDIIVIISFSVAILSEIQQSWMRAHGYGDMPSGMWTFLGIVFGAETLSFSLYQMVKEVKGAKTPKTSMAKHSMLKDLEDENGEAEKQKTMGDRGSISGIDRH